MADIIDLSASPPRTSDKEFRLEDWIGRGRKWPKDPPSELLAARDRVLAIPANALRLTPDTQLSVQELLALKLPLQPGNLVMTKATESFSTLAPNEDVNLVLVRRAIPPTAWIRALEKCVSQAWLDGNQSIIDSRVKSSRLPLWLPKYWRTLVLVHEKVEGWKAAYYWLTRFAQEAEEVVEADQARELLACIRWTAEVHTPDGKASIDVLSKLLSDQWYSDVTVDMLFKILADRVRNDSNLNSCFIIASTMLQRSLELTTQSKSDGVPRVNSLLRQYRDLIRASAKSLKALPIGSGPSDIFEGPVGRFGPWRHC
jgi:hypothetical protein